MTIDFKQMLRMPPGQKVMGRVLRRQALEMKIRLRLVNRNPLRFLPRM
ncbi:MAG TPA: hypothetical protein H9837_02990 [Candidatus Brachybacterium merdigallinarum]|nr:hypothetical protein [Candidatus Brachybacterium merdigallinarum]